MTLYWINSDIGSPKGNIAKHQFHTMEQFSPKTIQILLDKGVIRVIQSPPIEVMPEMKSYATLLKKKGIRLLIDVLAHRQDLHILLNISDTEAHSLIAKAEHILRPDVPLSDGG